MTKTRVEGVLPPDSLVEKRLVEGVLPPNFLPTPEPPAPGQKVYIDTIQGDKGDTGDSAYQTAVKLGFNGTEEEWILSLGAGGLIDPTTNLPPDNVVEALNTALIEPFELDLVTAYNLGKI